MGGFDHHGYSIVEEWMSPIPSPRFFSSVLKDDIPLEKIDGNPGHFVGYEEELNNDKNGARVTENVDKLHKTRRGGGLLERIAARAGFNAPRLNTESMKPSDLSISQDVRSPYLMIPPGLSPTTLLESPVFLSNSLVQPSPTTGKFLFASSGSNNKNYSFGAQVSDKNKDDQFFEDFGSQPFSFKPVADSGFEHFHGDQNRLDPLSYHHPESLFQGTENSLRPPNGVEFHIPMEFWKPSSEHDGSSKSIFPQSNTIIGAGAKIPLPIEEEDEDGYNWRKYGQKEVKGSQYPRSYYKCTHPNCTMKKKVERSHEGVVTEVIYKGSHSHTEPVTAPNQKPAMIRLDDRNDSMQSLRDSDSTPDWKMEDNHLEAMSEFRNVANNSLQAQKGARPLDSSITVVGSSTFSNDEDEDDQQEESKTSKRRKLAEAATYTTETTGGPTTRAGAVREPRVVVQTTSEVDILDDGYRWRKYGQKVVKGNPNPRSYYKCTSTGCTVRKHVERASNDLRSVITTYEGKHNHDVPAARNSSHIANSSTSSLHHLHRITDHPSHVQNEMSRFHNRPTAAPLGSYGLAGRQMMASYGSMNQTGIGSLGAMGSQGNMMPMSYIGQQSQMGLMMMPKGEPKLEPISDQQQPVNYNINFNNNNSIGNNGSSIYHQIMSRLPPLGGPQM
ncbi:probable WRKY transcription factor 2 [Impatiens glandulifera]|uniref:probable WRKY transcription factor 2 n=1 Tax=Impatiens glandulifera TaxID=253017 RepID=UPI001FB0D4BB|nr:probable WRKY transcription factor 2 [Impatiens glandulifera]